MDIQLKKWGNSLGLRIPHQLAVSLDIDETSTLELLEVDNTLILRKKQAPITLDALLASIPKDFQYPSDVQDFVDSPAMGQELL
ncbi:AbrB/MazE/SpoVT family DNA-binding domain-containing protein [Altericista sp. CCNU0014]|uniref:AbrB/MazE/SpoVT family DNA-binding domain-containing protein n=1 Tax=Altericista sp. CCNU0014 TaxID=3082949 RepID=UPI00384A6275